MELYNYKNTKVVTLEVINEYIIDKAVKNRCKNNLYKWVDKTNGALLKMDDARKYGQKRNFNYSRGLWVFDVQAVIKCFKDHSAYFNGKVDTETFVEDVKRNDVRSMNEAEANKKRHIPVKKTISENKDTTIKSNCIQEEKIENVDIPINQINMPFDEVYALVDRIGEHTAILVGSMAEKIEMLSNQIESLNEKVIALTSMRDELISNSVFEPIILKENDSYEEWKKGIKKALKLILAIAPGKTESDILHDAYNRLRVQYTIVWEQEAKEFKEDYGRSPINTKELCWWIETTKPNYKNLLISKLNTIYSEAKRGSLK